MSFVAKGVPVFLPSFLLTPVHRVVDEKTAKAGIPPYSFDLSRMPLSCSRQSQVRVGGRRCVPYKKEMRKQLLLGCLFFLSLLSLIGQPYDIVEFGAVADGRTLNTEAIQTAIDRCYEAGGGTVQVPAGVFLTGSIELRSNVHLFLSRGATLLGSTDIADYREHVPQLRSWTDRWLKHSLIYGENLSHISITGPGTIDGQGAAFRVTTKLKPDRYRNRPYLLRLVNCRDVRVEGLSLRNSAMWMQHYFACEDLFIRSLKVFNHANQNNDMLDIDGCRNVVIADCIGDTDDDGITLKSTSERITENVTITNCVLSSHANALKVGTESHGGFRNISISNIVIKPSAVDSVIFGSPRGDGGITLGCVDGGRLENVHISNVVIDGPRTPLFLRLGDRGRTYLPGQPRPAPGVFRNVTISDVSARGAGALGCSITGIPGHPVQDITLSNIRFYYRGGGAAPAAGLDVPEQEATYPGAGRFGPRPAYGLYLRHVEGIRLDNLVFRLEAPDPRPALVADDVQQLSVDGLQAAVSNAAPAFLHLRNARQVSIAAAFPEGAPAAFLKVEGAGSAGILLENGSGEASNSDWIVVGEEVPADALRRPLLTDQK